nr:hypothetical protein GCM10017745_34490 [Saccharothrix mutabilis subsp. capreolus]
MIVPPPHLEYLLIDMTGHHLDIPAYVPGGRANPGRMWLTQPTH